jgi:hypothetical protein
MKIDLRWSVKKANQLWIKWDSIELTGDGLVRLKNAKFFGPVMSDCAKIQESGSIYIDLTKHFIVLIPTPYIVKLTWIGVKSQDSKEAIFGELIVEDKSLGHLNKLKNTDLILLDCSGHTVEEESRGNYKSTYQAMVYKESMDSYDFS